jgi:hypothetical protein
MKFLREGRWSREVHESVVGGGRWMTVPRFAKDPPVPGICAWVVEVKVENHEGVSAFKFEKLLLNSRNEYGIDKDTIRIITKVIRLMEILLNE